VGVTEDGKDLAIATPKDWYDCPNTKCPQTAIQVPRLRDDFNRVICGSCNGTMVKRK